MRRRTVLVGLGAFIAGTSAANLGPITVERKRGEVEAGQLDAPSGPVIHFDTVEGESIGGRAPAISVDWVRGSPDDSPADRLQHVRIATNSRYTIQDIFKLNIDVGDQMSAGAARLRVRPTPGTTGHAITSDGELDSTILDVYVSNVHPTRSDVAADGPSIGASFVKDALEMSTNMSIDAGLTLDTHSIHGSSTDTLLEGGLRFVLEVAPE